MKPTRLAVEGWFRGGDAPALLGARGTESGSTFFPTAVASSANPHAPFEEREPVELSRTGVVWSWSTNHYAPPAPYVSPDPFVPYTVVAVELAAEQMVVLGLLDDGVDPALLHAGLEMELVVGTLFEDAEAVHQIWKWRPTNAGGAA